MMPTPPNGLGKFDLDKANCNPGAGKPSTSDTIYLAVVDKEGNIASLIQSNYSGFGSGVVVNGMGFALQNRGAPFSLDASRPNALQAAEASFSHHHSRFHGAR